MWCRWVLCHWLFDLVESRPAVAVKVLLDGLSQAERGYTQTFSLHVGVLFVRLQVSGVLSVLLLFHALYIQPDRKRS